MKCNCEKSTNKMIAWERDKFGCSFSLDEFILQLEPEVADEFIDRELYSFWNRKERNRYRY